MNQMSDIPTEFVIRVDWQSPHRIECTLFADLHYCGQLTFSREQYTAFVRCLLAGKGEGIAVEERRQEMFNVR